MSITNCQLRRLARLVLQFVGCLYWGSNVSAELTVHPSSFAIDGARQQLQLVVTLNQRDVTRDVEYSVRDSEFLRVDGNGTCRPVKNGTTRVLVSLGGETCECEVAVRNVSQPDPVSFDHETLPILAKSGCSGGACHGAPHGKAGFRLSLFGGDPEFDRDALVREARGRRVTPLQPENSLLLRKPTMDLPHMGGRRFATDSQPYQTLHNWIAEGSRVAPSETTCTKIEVFPTGRDSLMLPRGTQQFRVTATFSDGRRRDVTHIAKFESSDSSVADVNSGGLVRGQSRGDAAIIVRYLHHIETPLVTCVRNIEDFEWTAPPVANYVDKHVDAKLRQMQYLPSDICSDAVFLRRVYLDTIGLLPTPEEQKQFLNSDSATKRAELIDALLERPEYARFWAQKWGDLLRISRKQIGLTSVFKFSTWLRNAVADNIPYDQMARSLITAGGSTLKNPAANYYRTSADTNDAMETSAQLFLGTRIQCAKCHNHPFERWTQDNYYGLAAVFHRVERKKTDHPEERIIFASTSGDVIHPSTGRVAEPWVPTTGTLSVQTDRDRRAAFADWLVSDENPFFAAVEVNRIWAQVMGTGIVEPFDDFRDSNPPSNPQLLNALAEDFKSHKYDRKHILRTILNSRTYQAHSSTNRFNQSDSRYFSHYRPRRLTAEQLVDALSAVIGAKESFVGVPTGTKATWLPAPDLKPHDRGQLGSIDFLKVFGQPERQSVCECERGDESSLGQALQLLNGKYLHDRLSSDQNRIRQQLRQNVPPETIITDLYTQALCRQPTVEELTVALQHLSSTENKAAALEDICWVVVNKDEFLFQH